jgi:membrane fusion protein
VEESRAEALARRTEVESIGERIISQREALRAIAAQIAQSGLQASRSRSEVGAQRAGLAEQRAALLRTDRLTLTAPVAGEVGDISAQIGQRARPEASLVTIVRGAAESKCGSTHHRGRSDSCGRDRTCGCSSMPFPTSATAPGAGR